MGGHPAASFDGRRAGGAPRRGLPHRRHDAPPRGLHPRDVRRRAGALALVFGTEHAGISDGIVAAADEFLRIPMCGMVESLNVSASAAILIYMLSERVRLTVPGWRMPLALQAEVLERWMRRSVKDSEEILRRRFGSGGL